jgi:cytosine deaminase
MRVTFPRLADNQKGYAVIERDDGVVYRLGGFTLMGPKLPHDLTHLIVERELRVSDGIWGSIAAGTVYASMHHLRGRRPPHAADRSEQLKRAQRTRIMRAELLANLIEAVVRLDDQSPDEIRRLTRMKLSVVPVVEPGQDPADVVALPPPEVLAAAASALQVETARWARLRVGEELVYEWPCLVSIRLVAAPEVLQIDREMMALALQQARASLDAGGVPVGAVLAAGGEVVAAGHNERVQHGDPVAHGEISALRNAGRRATYADTTLYTTLSPCQMCTGAILLFQIPRVVVGEASTFEGDLDFLRSRGVEIVLLDDPGCMAAMEEFQTRYPEVWSEDIGGR